MATSQNHLIFYIILIFSILLPLVVTGCSGSEATTDHSEHHQHHHNGHHHETHPEQTPHDMSELEALFWARIDSSRMNFVQADIDFMTDMIAHHAQALIMSRLAPENGASASVQRLASRIINAQGDEIETMQKWLRDRHQPVPEVHIDGLILMIHMEGGDEHGMHSGHHGHGAMHHHHDMPGMLTQEQLEELAAADGSEFDRKFLTFMIEHHEGAIYMVDELFAADGAALDRELFDLASGINAEQVTEIDRMWKMLDEMN
ncbi:MAG: DUF305 domain-containing protein [Balneolaceae bacterium]|nr:MAG: DUF305 domain-containing protein [Balneolaceae bacterium]